jgi:hypothetical protein
MTYGQGLKTICCGLLAVVATAAPPAFAADAHNGERLARRWCEPCHVVASDQRQVTGEASPFASIARRPNFDPAKLALFRRAGLAEKVTARPAPTQPEIP